MRDAVLKGNCPSVGYRIEYINEYLLGVLNGEGNVLGGREDEVFRVLAPLLGGGQFRLVGVCSVELLSPQDLLLI